MEWVEWGGVEWVGLNPILVSALAPFGSVEVGAEIGAELDNFLFSPGLISLKVSKALRYYLISSPVVPPKKCLVFYFISIERKQGVTVSLHCATQLIFTVCLPEINCINSM